MPSPENKIPKLITDNKPANRILKRHLEAKETENGRSQIRLSIDKSFYGFTPNEKSVCSSIDMTLDDGRPLSIWYHHINSFVTFDDLGNLIFEANDHQIKIVGRNLRPIYEYIQEMRLVWIQGALSDWEEFPEDETVVESVTVTPLSESD